MSVNTDLIKTAAIARQRDWMRFAIVAGAAVAVLAAGVALVGFKLAGTTVSGWIDYPVQAGAPPSPRPSFGFFAPGPPGRPPEDRGPPRAAPPVGVFFRAC